MTASPPPSRVNTLEKKHHVSNIFSSAKILINVFTQKKKSFQEVKNDLFW